MTEDNNHLKSIQGCKMQMSVQEQLLIQGKLFPNRDLLPIVASWFYPPLWVVLSPVGCFWIISVVPHERENRSSRFPTRSDTNRAVQAQKQAGSLKLWI